MIKITSQFKQILRISLGLIISDQNTNIISNLKIVILVEQGSILENLECGENFNVHSTKISITHIHVVSIVFIGSWVTHHNNNPV